MNKKLYQQLWLLFLLFLFSSFSYGQLSDFTLTVTPTNETCTANGALNFSVSNTTSGSTIVYSIYKLPNTTTPVAVVSTSVYTGLTSGNYRVIATQSLGNQSGTQQQDVTILNQTEILTYLVTSSAEVCGNDAAISITILSGTPSGYEIIAGPMIRPVQTSNVFTGLASGQYTIRVFDTCTEGVVQTYTVISKNPALVFTPGQVSLSGCNSVSFGFGFSTLVPSPNGVVKYPLQVVTTVTPPSGSPIVTTNTITTGNSFSTTTPLFTPQPYSYSFVITDGCGTVYTVSGVINNITNSVTTTLLPVSCDTKKIQFAQVAGLILIGAPASYPNPLPQDFTNQIVNNGYTTLPLGIGIYTFQVTNLCGQIQTVVISIESSVANPPYSYVYGLTCNSGSLAFNNVSQIVLVSAPSSYTGVLPYDFTSTINTFGVAVLVNLPPGTYICNIVDSCGNTAVLTETITPVSAAPSYGIFPDCSNNNINTVSIHGQLNAIILTTAPATYTGTVPHDFTLQVLNGSLNLVNLPVGTYNFMVTNSCGNVVTLNVIVPVQTETFTVNAAQNCGSFNLDLHYTSNGAGASTFWLQKYYTTGADWGDPDTGVLQGTDIPNDNNALQLTNNFLTLNLPYSGQFRVVKVQPVYIPGSDVPGYCFKVINEFQTNGQPQIIGVNSVACNGAFDVIVEATGFGPLTYKITAKNGLPFIINNGNSNLFSGLTAAVYNFQVTDFCGNIVNSVLEINVQNPLTITAVNLCPNEAASLSVPNFSFLTYQWWNTNNPSVILSTTNILNFPNFNPTTSAGTYTVGIVYVGNSSSCLNTQLNYAITSNNFMPNAGNGTTVAYCGGQPTFDLFTLLQGPYDTGGTWQVVTNNTSISGSSWNSTNAAALLYQFKYTVTGNCSISDQTIVSVTIKDIPQIPIATVDPIVCDSQNINLFASAIPGASYLWTGPNGFSSSNQNPVINNATTLDNGSYSVKAIEAGCESNESAVDVLVSPSPQFTLEGLCNGGRFKVTAIPVNYSFDPSSVSYSWSGPNGYTNTVNPIDITQLPTGDYSLTITNISGCISSQSIPVSYTFCEIPNVITPNDDGANDSFDLSGLEVEKLEIYSRWGRKVYEKDNYTNEWHGQNMHGDYLPDSTYYYYITLKNKEAKVGWVFMTRG